jgi:hypothetical protein
MAQFEINPASTVAPSWASATPERIDHSVPPPPANRHIVLESTLPTVVEIANQFVKYGESNGIRNINDRRRLLRLFDDFKGNSGVDNRDEFSRVLFELSRNQKLFRVVAGVSIDWNDGSSTKHTPSGDSRSIDPRDNLDTRRDPRDTRDITSTRRDPRDTRDNLDTRRDPRDTRDITSTRRDPRDTRDITSTRRDPRDTHQDTRRNYEQDYARHERPRDNEDPRDRRINELMRTIESMERSMDQIQNRLDSISNGCKY